MRLKQQKTTGATRVIGARRITSISRRFLFVRTCLIVLSLGFLLILYISLLLFFTLWQRGEWAHENYANLVRQVSLQEYFVARMSESLPYSFCDDNVTCEREKNIDISLPPRAALPLKMLTPKGERLWVLHNGDAGHEELQKQQINNRRLLALGESLAHFDREFFGGIASKNQSFLSAADGSLSILVPHGVGWQDAGKLQQYADEKLAAFRRTLEGMPENHNKDGVYWTDALTSPFTNDVIFTSFFPLKNRNGELKGYISTDISPDVVSGRGNIEKATSDGHAGLTLMYFRSNLMLINGVKPTPSEMQAYRHHYDERDDSPALQFRKQGAMLQISYTVPYIEWRMIYAVSVWDMLAAAVLPASLGVLLFLLLTAAAIRGALRIQRDVIAPAARQARRLEESENFNRSIVESSPVGLAVLREQDASVMLQNALFIPTDRWRLVDEQNRDVAGDIHANLKLLAAGRAGDWHLEDRNSASFYQLGVVPGIHQDEPVFICVLIDMTDRRRAQQALEVAKMAAESASAAKSMFLATISHEIRTPLYGMQASVELMGKTRLDEVQQQLTQTMDSSVRTLKDVLNDALDFTKGEVEQVELDSEIFDLTQTIEAVVQGFGSRALLKNLQLYCLVDPALSGTWMGDPIKLGQIFNNLLNNAVKFSVRGSVIMRVILQEIRGRQAQIVFSVEDSGPGIAAAEIDRLFQPFSQLATSNENSQISGTGLGLYICKRFVAAMGGSIAVSSEPGRGSIFTVSMTLTQPEAGKVPVHSMLQGLQLSISAAPPLREHLHALMMAREAAVDIAALPTGENGEIACLFVSRDKEYGGGVGAVYLGATFPCQPLLKAGDVYVSTLSTSGLMDAILIACGRVHFAEPAVVERYETDASVLIVDDQVINRLLLESQLRHFGCRVTSVGSGEDALMHAEDADLILTDLNMPGMNGKELCRQLRRNGVRCPIIAVTASLLAGEGEDCLKAGMNGHLIKPFSMDDLERVLQRHVNRLQVEAVSASEVRDAAAQTLTMAARMWRPEMMRVAVASIAEDAVQLAQGIAGDDLEYLGRVAHRIHGGMAALDMRPAMALCQAIEDSVEFEWREEAYALALILERMLGQIREDIDPDA